MKKVAAIFRLKNNALVVVSSTGLPVATCVPKWAVLANSSGASPSLPDDLGGHATSSGGSNSPTT